MQFSIPQFIETEDKIIGPLTLKQFLWLLGAAGVLTVIWMSTRNIAIFVVSGIPVGTLFLSMAFIKVNGRSLPVFIANVFSFFTRPNLYIWRREYEKESSMKAPVQQSVKKEAVEEFTQSKIEELAWILDTRGSVDKAKDNQNQN